MTRCVGTVWACRRGLFSAWWKSLKAASRTRHHPTWLQSDSVLTPVCLHTASAAPDVIQTIRRPTDSRLRRESVSQPSSLGRTVRVPPQPRSASCHGQQRVWYIDAAQRTPAGLPQAPELPQRSGTDIHFTTDSYTQTFPNRSG